MKKKEDCILTCEKCGEEIRLNYDDDIYGLLKDDVLDLILPNKLRSKYLQLKHSKNGCNGNIRLSRTIDIRMKFKGW